MNWKQLAAAALLACVAIPAEAWDYREQDQPFTFVFMRIPLDGRSTREQMPVWGLAVRGKRDYQAFTVDTQTMTRFAELGFVESKLLIVGAVAAAGVVAVAASGASAASTQQAQQQQAQQQQALAQQQAAAAAQQQAAAQQAARQSTPAAPCPRTPAC